MGMIVHATSEVEKERTVNTLKEKQVTYCTTKTEDEMELEFLHGKAFPQKLFFADELDDENEEHLYSIFNPTINDVICEIRQAKEGIENSVSNHFFTSTQEELKEFA